MRHAMIAVGGLAVALTVIGWLSSVTSDRGEPTAVASVAAADPAAVVPVSTVPPSTLPLPTLPAQTLPAQTLPAQTLPPPTVPVEAERVDTATAFHEALDARRAAEGIAPLERHTGLDTLAQSWAEQLAADGSLHHSELIYDVVGGSWVTAGENLGYGPSVDAVVDALVASPGHLANMVNADFTDVGIGVVRVDGVLWTAHLFAG